MGNTLRVGSLEEGRAQGKRHACLKVHKRQLVCFPFGFPLYRTTALELVPSEGLMKVPGLGDLSCAHHSPCRSCGE